MSSWSLNHHIRLISGKCLFPPKLNNSLLLIQIYCINRTQNTNFYQHELSVAFTEMGNILTRMHMQKPVQQCLAAVLAVGSSFILAESMLILRRYVKCKGGLRRSNDVVLDAVFDHSLCQKIFISYLLQINMTWPLETPGNLT